MNVHISRPNEIYRFYAGHHDIRMYSQFICKHDQKFSQTEHHLGNMDTVMISMASLIRLNWLQCKLLAFCLNKLILCFNSVNQVQNLTRYLHIRFHTQDTMLFFSVQCELVSCWLPTGGLYEFYSPHPLPGLPIPPRPLLAPPLAWPAPTTTPTSAPPTSTTKRTCKQKKCSTIHYVDSHTKTK